MRRQIPAAAGLIQCLWRCYAADKSFYSKVLNDDRDIYDGDDHQHNDKGDSMLMTIISLPGHMEDPHER